MFNVGLLEMLFIAVLGLLIFGPDKLPKAIQALVVGLRSLRSAAEDASKSLQGAAGVDGDSAQQAMSEIAELHPKNWVPGLLSDPGEPSGAGSVPGSANRPADSVDSPGKPAQEPAASSDLDPDLP